MKREANVSEMQGCVLTAVIGVEGSHLIFECANGAQFQMYHEQDCCETVTLESVEGDLADLIGEPLLIAEEVCDDAVASVRIRIGVESSTWTFYKFATVKGYVTLRWFGESNGYYSESVDFFKCK